MRYLRGIRNIRERAGEEKKSRRVASRRAGIVQKLRVRRRFLQIRRAARETYMPSPATKIKMRPATFSPACLHYAIFSAAANSRRTPYMHSAYAPRFYAAFECRDVAKRRIFFHYNPLKARRVRRLLNILLWQWNVQAERSSFSFNILANLRDIILHR